ncbi:polysaccharide pyruvyl transferase family protein [Hoylesella buccalis]
MGPCEFIWLFQHAKFVITTSFHGMAFATLFEKPLSRRLMIRMDGSQLN